MTSRPREDGAGESSAVVDGAEPAALGAPPVVRGLLEDIASNALDDDYYEVRSGRYSRSRGPSTALSALVLALFAALLTVAAVQTRAEAPGNLLEREALVGDISSRRATLDDRQSQLGDLRDEVDALRAELGQAAPGSASIAVLTGEEAVSGDGARVELRPSDQGNDDGRILDRDLQLVVNGLWYAGAEAVALNGNRLGPMSAIRYAGGAITVNYRTIEAPYVVEAVGDPGSLVERFEQNPSGRYLQDRRRTAGIRFSVDEQDDLRLDAVPVSRLTPRHATEGKETP